MGGEAGKGYDSTKGSKKDFDEGWDNIKWEDGICWDTGKHPDYGIEYWVKNTKCKCGHAKGGDCLKCPNLIKKEKKI